MPNLEGWDSLFHRILAGSGLALDEGPGTAQKTMRIRVDDVTIEVGDDGNLRVVGIGIGTVTDAQHGVRGATTGGNPLHPLAVPNGDPGFLSGVFAALLSSLGTFTAIEDDTPTAALWGQYQFQASGNLILPTPHPLQVGKVGPIIVENRSSFPRTIDSGDVSIQIDNAPSPYVMADAEMVILWPAYENWRILSFA